jgi:signal transduction histidine kinase/ligand-binding sensor domain-containing protein/CheY-like chemotaxis protein
MRAAVFRAALLAIVGVLGGAWQVCWAEDEHPAPPPLLRILSLADGLPSNEILDLVEDSSGDMWLATNAGLVRYDGHSFELWRPPGMPRGAVETVLVDAQDRLWLGLVDGGLLALESDRRSFSHWHRQDPPGWPANDVWSLLATRDGRILIGSFEQGLVELDPASGQWRHDPLGEDVSVLDMIEQPDGTLWLATRSHGLFRRSPGGLTQPLRVEGIDGEQLRALIWYQGSLWAGVADRGLCRLAAAASAGAVGSDLQCEAWPELQGLSRRVMSLAARPGGELWVARRDGLSWREPGGRWSHLAPRPGALGSLPPRIPMSMQFDSSGGLWIATLGGGVAYLSPLASTAQAWVALPGEGMSLPQSRVRAVVPQRDRVWVGTQETGLWQLDRRSGVFHQVSADRIEGSQRIWALADRPEGIWVARDGGVSLLRDPSDADLHWPLGMEGGPGDGLPDGLLGVDDGSMLVSVNGRGLYRLAAGENFAAVPADQHSPQAIEQLLNTAAGIWLASERGLHRYDRQCDCMRWWPQLNRRVHAIARDGAGRWWLALDDRLELRDAGAQPGAVLRVVAWPTAAVGGIAADAAGRLWIAGPSGLAVLEPGAERVRHLAGSLGPIAAELSGAPFTVGSDGTFWFGSDRGALRIDPTRLPAAPMPRRLHIERIGLRRGGEAVELSSGSPGRLKATDRDLQVLARVPLPLEAAALHFRSRIEGWDEDWIDQPDGRRVIGVLPPGHYQLQLQAWHPASPEQLVVGTWPFSVAPPWWRQLPFLLLWLLLLAGMVWTVHRWQKRRLDSRHALALHQSQAQWAERSAAEKSAFLAQLSHEIRNPLSGLLGMLRLAQADPDPASQRQRLDLVRSAAQQIEALVDDVLVWSRRERGTLQLQCGSVELAGLVDEVLARQQPQADARGLLLHGEGDRQLCVRADRCRLLQIIDNLLGNALKFTERGQIDLGWRATAGQRVLLWVQDDGPGIATSERASVFEKHRQLGVEGRGLGLGLSIARSLAEAMGGRLGLVDPAPGRSGARFELELELALPEAPFAGSAPDATATQQAAGPAAERAWLLVEDDPLQRASLVHELDQAGFRVAAVADALSALGQLRADPELGLITDLGLPEVDGLSLIRMVRGWPPEAGSRRPILVLTARALAADRSAAFEAGADVVLHKPIEPAELAAELRRAGDPG